MVEFLECEMHLPGIPMALKGCRKWVSELSCDEAVAVEPLIFTS